MTDHKSIEGSWAIFPHDADIGVRGIGRDPPEAFENAALALMAEVTPLANVKLQEAVPVSCQAPDLEVLFDLLTGAEASDRANVFDISLLASRVIDALSWVNSQPDLKELELGLFGSSTGAAAALVAAARAPRAVAKVVSRGGRPDLADPFLGRVDAATLLIPGGADHGVNELNDSALSELRCEKRLEIVPGATHLFEEPGTLDAVVDLAAKWSLDGSAEVTEGHDITTIPP